MILIILLSTLSCYRYIKMIIPKNIKLNKKRIIINNNIMLISRIITTITCIITASL